MQSLTKSEVKSSTILYVQRYPCTWYSNFPRKLVTARIILAFDL